ncbi:MAG: hypothetical protein NTV31_10200, partial [Bacteroidia bacterium]|nr:hypothetical protein [Bacteroidia bacterium]
NAGSVNIGAGMTTGAITIGGTAAQTGTIGIGTGTGAQILNFGTGTGLKTINVGGTGANIISMGNTQTAGSIALGAAMTTGTITIGGTGAQTGTIGIGTGTGAQTINFGSGTGIKTINVGGTGANVIGLGNTQAAGSIAMGNAMTTGTITIGGTGAQTGTITVGSSTAAQTVNIGTGTGANAVNVATGGTGNVIIGNATGTVTLPKLTLGSIPFAGTGGLISQDNANLFWNNTNKWLGIGTGAPVNKIAIGGATKEAISRDIRTGTLEIMGGVSEATGAYFQITGDKNASSPYEGSAEFVIRDSVRSQFALFSYDRTTWTQRFQVKGSNGNTWLTPGGGFVGVGLKIATTPTALLHLAAGTIDTATLKFTPGVNLTTPAAGAVEYDGTVFYSTPVASSRGVSPSEYFIALTSNYTGTDNNSAQKVFNSPANGTITLSASTSYLFEGQYSINSAGGTSTSLGTLFGGTATFTSIGYTAITAKGATLGMTSFVNTAGVSTVTQANTTNNVTVIIRGIVRINAGGTFIPQFQFSAAPGAAPIVATNSYFKIYPIGTNTVNYVGNWN